jgi:BirA family biotin operon repressor/biotin-[acetyl-CoA-carboxylase] ligase
MHPATATFPPSWHVTVVDETGSTNADLLAEAAAGAPDQTVLAARHQTAGRGRLDRRWDAPPGSNLLVSMLFRTVPEHPHELTQRVALAACDAAVELTGRHPTLKWPNDVLVGEGKLGGILAEVAAPDSVIVVGLGLNVTLKPDEAPDARATSLLMLGSTMLDRSALLGAVLAELSARIDRWRSAGGPDAGLIDDYRRRSVTLGNRVRATLPRDREIVGTATDLDELGQLHIDTGTQTVAVSAGDITHLRPADE